MAVSGPSGWRFNLLLFVLVGSFAASGFFVWDRRSAWHIVETLEGNLWPFGSGSDEVPYIYDPERATMFFPDTRVRCELPAKFRNESWISQVASTRAAFVFYGGPHDEDRRKPRCWDVAARREVPIPASAKDSWRLSASGTRLLVSDYGEDGPRPFQILGLDGTVLHQRMLPPMDTPMREAHYEYSPDGNYLVVSFQRYGKGERVRIYDMTSDASWSFEDNFGGLTDDGVLWLTDASQKMDRGYPLAVRAMQLRTGQELWNTPVPEGVSEIAYIGRNRLAVQIARDGPYSMALWDALSGRQLFLLEEGRAASCPRADFLKIRDGGATSYLVCFGAWSFDTGKSLPLGFQGSVQFFDDGRRVLRPADCDPNPNLARPPEILDLKTGRSLFRFRSPKDGTSLGISSLVGNRVLTQDNDSVVEVWERRHPEGWKGHFQRPEVLVSVFLGAAILVLWANRPRHEHPSQAS